MSGRAASAEIYLQGAHVTSWVPSGQDPVLWMSAAGQFGAGLALRGGVPVCFPWFGPAPSAGGGPLHGFARISDWTLLEAVEKGDDVMLRFLLEDTEASRASVWPHAFEARYEITVGAELLLRLTVTNTGTVPITFEEAFHTYLGVGDVQKVTIDGLGDMPYVDRLGGDHEEPPAGESLQITAETDRVYAQPGRIVVRDPAGGCDLTVATTGSANAVVWNPGAAKAVAMGDFGDEEWREMVCVETCNVRERAVTLGAGAERTMAAAVSATSTAPRGTGPQRGEPVRQLA
ncbi:D-hexose-6-phosphate mutarotase [Cellulomonas sp. WB94]|uniref:D-hexose-6-phosphate mutarotase n=1 Tax=Cellulomonas sp. WB94 TaxID=2173174 RepID=UPI0013049CD1|nr:D-hexose-6-phosphate mutarotase [Cellulomonas sp. WB94]